MDNSPTRRGNTPARERSVGRRLLLSILLVALIPLIIVDIATIVFNRAQTIQDVNLELQNGTTSSAQETTIAIAEQRAILADLRQNSEIQAALTEQQLAYEGTADIDALIQQRANAWPNLELTSPEVQSVLLNPASTELLDFRGDLRFYEEVIVTDAFGALVATTSREVGYFYGNQSWFQQTASATSNQMYISPNVFVYTVTDRPVVELAVPIFEPNQAEVIGVVHALYDVVGLSTELTRLSDVETQYLLVDQLGAVLFAPAQGSINPNTAIDLPAVPALISSAESAEVLNAGLLSSRTNEIADLDGEAAAAIIEPVANLDTNLVGGLEWYVVGLAPSEVYLAPIQQTTSILLGVLVAVLAVGVLVSAQLARTFTQPLNALTQGVRQIAGEGDLSTRVDVTREDEFGELGQAFNLMAEQLEDTITTLEERVSARTRDLEIAAEVSQQISRSLSLEEMLPQVAELTKESFGLYHAHVYLLNDKDMLVMEAGAGSAGQFMKEQNHAISLNAERSLVARAARSKEAVSVSDVVKEPGHLPNPLLPDTRSELALPLMVEDDVLGVLDVQSDKVDFFKPENILVMNTLAGQVSIAVQNARSFENLQLAQAQTRNALDNLARQNRFSAAVARVATNLLNLGIDGLNDSMRILGEASRACHVFFLRQVDSSMANDNAEVIFDWASVRKTPHSQSPEFVNMVLSETMPNWYKELAQGNVVQSLRVEEQNEAERALMEQMDVRSVLIIPVMVENNLFGIIGMDETEEDRLWEASEIELMQTAAISVAYTITGARLLRQTEEALFQVETLYQIGRRLNELDNPQQLLQTFVEPILNVKQGTATLHLVISDDAGNPVLFELAARHHTSTVVHDDAPLGTQYDLETFQLLELIFDNLNEIQSVVDVENDARINPTMLETLRETGIRSLTLIPLVPLGRRWVGLVTLVWSDTVSLSDDEYQMLDLLAPQFANVLDNQRLLRQTSLALSEAELLYESSRQIIEAPSTQELLQAVAQRSFERGSTSVTLFSLQTDSEGDPVAASVAASAATDDGIAMPVNMDFEISAIPFADLWLKDPTRPQFINDIKTSTQFTEAQKATYTLLDVRALVVMPLAIGQRWIGLITVNFPEEQRFSRADQRFYGQLATQIAAALETQQSLVETQRALDRLDVVVNSIPNLLIVFDEDYIYREVYASSPDMLIAPAEELIGTSFRDVMPVDIMAQLEEASEKVAVTNAPVNIRYTLDIGGSNVYFEGIISPIANSSNMLLSINDITENELRQLRQTTAYELAQELSATFNEEQLLSRTIEQLNAGFGFYHAHIYLINEDTETLTVAEGLGEAGASMKARQHSIPLSAQRSLVAQAARTNDVVVVNDVRQSPGHLPNPLLPKTRSEVAIPMESSGQVLGVLDVQHDQKDHFGDEEIQLLQIITTQLSSALENTRLIDELQLQRAAVESSLVGVTIADARQPDMPLTYINQAFTDITGYDAEEALGRNCRFLQGDDRDQEALEELRAAFKEGRETTVLLRNYRKDGSLFYNELSVSPIYNRDNQLTYFVGLQADITERIRQTERAELGRDLARSLSSLLDPQQLLSITVNQLAGTFNYYHAHIYLLNEAEQVLYLAEGLGEAGENLKQRKHAIPLNASRSFVAAAARNNQSLNVANVAADPGHLPNPLLPKTQSEIAVPISLGERVIGVLDVQQDYPNAFDAAEVSTLEVVASQLAVALSNAELFAETEQNLALTESLYAASSNIAEAGSFVQLLQAIARTQPPAHFERLEIHLFDDPVASGQPVGSSNRVASYTLTEDATHPVTPSETLTPDMLNVMREYAEDSIFISEDILHDERLGPDMQEQLASRLRANSKLSILLTDTTRRWLGWITMLGTEAGEVDEATQRFYRSLGEQASTTVSNQLLLNRIRTALVSTAESERLVRSVIDSSVDWIFMKDRDLRFVLINQKNADDAFGLPPDEIIGKRDEDFFDIEYIEGNDEIRGFRRDDLKVLNENRMVFNPNDVVQLLNGEEHIFETRKIPVTDNDGNVQYILGVSRDVTEQRRIERRQQTAYEMARQLTATLEIEELLDTTVNQIARAFEYYYCHIYLLDQAEGILTVYAGLGHAGAEMKRRGHSIPVSAGRSLVARAARTLEPVVVNDVRTDPFHLPNPLLPDTISEAAIPLAVGNEIVGVLDVQQNRAEQFNNDEIRTLSILASQLAIAISNAELYQEQLATMEKLREVDQLKSEFLANMSHELRTPLNSIIGYSELLIDEMEDQLDEMALDDIKAIHSSGHHLLAIINDVLDLAKIEAGRMELNRSEVDLGSTIPQIVDMLRVQLRDKPQVDLKVVMEEDLPSVNADAVRIRQVIWNLLSNAIKFTEEGYVQVGVGTVNDRWIHVEIKDTGIGIPHEQHNYIFDQFRQADGSATRKAGGTGLGLAITRQLARLHGGDVWLAESEPGVGSVFILSVPLSEVSNEAEDGYALSNGHTNGRSTSNGTNGHHQSSEEAEKFSGE